MVLELTKLEYQIKWYMPNYFANSILGPNISKINGNGPFCPRRDMLTALYLFLQEESFVCHPNNGPRGMKSAWISMVVGFKGSLDFHGGGLQFLPYSIGFFVHNHTLGWVRSSE